MNHAGAQSCRRALRFVVRKDFGLTNSTKNCVLTLGFRHSVEPRNPNSEHAKKCVFGVFLNHTRIALVCKI